MSRHGCGMSARMYSSEQGVNAAEESSALKAGTFVRQGLKIRHTMSAASTARKGGVVVGCRWPLAFSPFGN